MDKPEKKKIDTRSMAKRLFSTLLLWGIVAGVFLSGQIIAVVALICILAMLGGVEFLLLKRATPGARRRIGAFIVSVIYLIALSAFLICMDSGDSTTRRQHLMNFTPEILGVVVTVFVSFCSSLSKEIKGVDPIYAVATSILTFIYVPLLFGGFMSRLVFLPPITEVSSPLLSGAWLVLFVSVVTKFTDMGAYLSGTLFGATKMIKHISPGKTWEGTLGSFVVAQGGAFAVWHLAGERLDWMGPWWSIMILAFLISVVAIIGDLAESIIKRSVKIKDSGGVLPGIGGVLDLVDSLCFAAPVAYFYLLFTAIL